MSIQEEPLVSILTTVYNRELFLADCLESVLSLKYQNWELIIVDDKSTDNSVEIARFYEKKDSRIKLFINKKNLGDYPNRNKAASYAKGKYLKYVDADDLIYPYSLNIMVEAMELDEEIGVALSNKSDQKNPFPHILMPRDAFIKHFFEGEFLNNAPSSVIIRKAVFEKIGGFSGKRMVGDAELWQKIVMLNKVCLLPQNLSFYRVHGDQEIVTQINRSYVFKYAYQITWDLICHPNFPFSNDEKELIKRKIFQLNAKKILKDLVITRNYWQAYYRYKYFKFNLILLIRFLMIKKIEFNT